MKIFALLVSLIASSICSHAQNIEVQRQKDSTEVHNLNIEGIKNLNQGKLPEAISTFQQASESSRRVFGIRHDLFLKSQLNLAVAYYHSTKFAIAESLLVDTKKLYAETKSAEDLRYADILLHIGNIYILTAKYEKAQDYFIQVLEIYKKNRQASTEQYAIVFTNLASAFNGRSMYKDAEYLYIKVLDLLSGAKKQNSKTFATTASSLGQLYIQLNRYAEADSLIHLTLSIDELIHSKLSADYALDLNFLGLIYTRQAQYDKAEQFYIQALDILKKLGYDKQPEYITSLNNLACLYSSQGRYAQAKVHFFKLKRLQENANITKTPDYLTTLSNISSIFQREKNYSASDSLDLKILITSKENGYRALYANALSRLGKSHQNAGRDTSAERYYHEALLAYKDEYDELHSDYILGLNDLAFFYKYEHRYAESEKYYRQAITLQKQLMGAENPRYATYLHNLAYCLYAQGRFLEVDRLEREAFNIEKQFFVRELPFYSVSDYLLLVESSPITPFLEFARVGSDTAAAKIVFDYLLYVKVGLQNRSLAFRELLSAECKNADCQEVLSAYVKSKGLLSNPSMKMPASKRDSILTRRNQYEAELLRRLPKLKQVIREAATDWSGIKKGLQNGEVAIEFFQAAGIGKDAAYDNTFILGAILIDVTMLAPKAVILRIIPDSLINGLELGKDSKQYNYKGALDNLTSELKQVVAPYKRIFYSTDQSMSFINLGALPWDSASIWCNHFDIVRVFSTRILAQPNKAQALRADSINKNAMQSIYLFGGLDYLYNQDTTGLKNLFSRKGRYSLPAKETNFHPAEINLRGSAWENLPNSSAEVVAIRNLLPNSTTCFMSPESGFEEDFYKITFNAPSLLLFSTHGFFFQKSPENDRVSLPRPRGSDELKRHPDPMGRCGLAMAGANVYFMKGQRAKGMEDGILTGLEIMDQPLDKVELCILSACVTGLGIPTMEGVMGLQRAFAIAGVHKMLVSSWAVSDKGTKELMIAFFRRLKQHPKPRWALREAIIDLRSSVYDDKKYWAAFTLIEN